MSNHDQNPIREELDDAVSSRLARLRSMPVDVSRLDAVIQRQIPRPPGIHLRWLRPLRAAAASILVLASIVAAVLIATSTGPALASPAQMAQVHRDIVANRVSVTRVESIDEASRVLAGASSSAPNLPNAPDAHVMACCMKDIKDKKVACVLLKSEGVPVTMSVARASDMRLPKGPHVVRNGVAYFVESHETLNMVMAEHGGRWICLIGELPSERLIEVAAKLQF